MKKKKIQIEEHKFIKKASPVASSKISHDIFTKLSQQVCEQPHIFRDIKISHQLVRFIKQDKQFNSMNKFHPFQSNTKQQGTNNLIQNHQTHQQQIHQSKRTGKKDLSKRIYQLDSKFLTIQTQEQKKKNK